MASNVFLAPCDPERFDRTVRTPIDLDDHPDRPPQLADEEAVRLWVADDGANAESTFERMEPGDLVLFYRGDTYVGTGLVGATFEDGGWASETFWDGEAGEHVYTVEEFEPVSVPKAAVNRIFDYSEGYTARGFMRVADGRVANTPEAIKRALTKYTERRG